MQNIKEIGAAFVVIMLAVFLGTGLALGVSKTLPGADAQLDRPLGGLALCTVTETLVTIGNQAATTVLSAAPGRQWALIQQPTNATNTVAVSLGGTATVGRGFELTPATTTSPVPELRLGFSTPIPYQGAVTARTGTGSTTIKVTECR